MADKKISELSVLTSPAADDLLVVVDVSDTTMAAAGTNKKITRAVFGTPPSKLIELGSTFINYHQSHIPVVTGTFTAQSTTVELDAEISGTVQGSYVSGHVAYLKMGIANGSGDLVKDVVGAPVASGATLLSDLHMGGFYGEYGRLEAGKRIRVSGLMIGTVYTVGIWTGEASSADNTDVPSGSNLGALAMTPDRQNIWASAFSTGKIHCFQIGLRILAGYNGVQPKLLLLSTLDTPGVDPVGMAIDVNGKGAFVNFTAKTLTVFDALANNGMGAISVTSAAQTPIIGGLVGSVAAMPDGSGFWVSCNDGTIKKFNTSAAVTSTVTVGDGTGTVAGAVCVDPDGTKVYVARRDKNDIVTVTISGGTSATLASGLNAPNAMAISPDGDYLLYGSNTATKPITRVATSGGATLDMNQYGSAENVGAKVNSVVVSDDSYQWFAFGNDGCWLYGRVSDMVRYDGALTANANTADRVGSVITNVEGVYYSTQSGSPSEDKVRCWPGSTLHVGGGNLDLGHAQILVTGGS